MAASEQMHVERRGAAGLLFVFALGCGGATTDAGQGRDTGAAPSDAPESGSARDASADPLCERPAGFWELADAAIEPGSPCSSDDDCAAVSATCPFDCYAVNREHIVEAQNTIDELSARHYACMTAGGGIYDCFSTCLSGPAVCRQGQCERGAGVPFVYPSRVDAGDGGLQCESGTYRDELVWRTQANTACSSVEECILVPLPNLTCLTQNSGSACQWVPVSNEQAHGDLAALDSWAESCLSEPCVVSCEVPPAVECYSGLCRKVP